MNATCLPHGKKTFILIMVLLAVCIFIGGCAGKETADSAKSQSAEKILRIGVETNYAPFEFKKKDSNEVVGYDIDLIKAVCKRMGYTPNFINTSLAAMIPAIDADKLDVAVGAFTISEERKQRVDFSAPYFQSGLVIYVRKDRADINSLKDLEGKRIAVQIGSTGEDLARSIKGAKVLAFNTIGGANREIKSDAVDAGISDLTAVEYFLINGGDRYCKIVGEKLTSEEYGIMVKKNSPLLGRINKALSELKNDGEQAAIYAKWFKK